MHHVSPILLPSLLRALLPVLLVAMPLPASADWKAANPAVEAAARDPEIAAVLAETVKVDAALVARDRATFVDMFASDAIVNGPANRVNTGAEAGLRFDQGMISYDSYRRTIEYAGKRANGVVVLMGEEAVTPRAPNPLAGKAVRRRFTDVWQKQGDVWKLGIRQATIFEVR